MRVAEASLSGYVRRVHAEYVGQTQFRISLTEGGEEVAGAGFTGPHLKRLIDDRATIVSVPLQLSRDGRDVIIATDTEAEWGRIHSEVLRDLVQRAVRLSRRV